MMVLKSGNCQYDDHFEDFSVDGEMGLRNTGKLLSMNR